MCMIKFCRKHHTEHHNYSPQSLLYKLRAVFININAFEFNWLHRFCVENEEKFWLDRGFVFN